MILRDIKKLPIDPAELQELLTDQKYAMSQSVPQSTLFKSHLLDFGIKEEHDAFIIASHVNKALRQHYSTPNAHNHLKLQGDKLDEVIFIINLARFGMLLRDWFIAKDAAEYTSELCKLDTEFPSQFVSSWSVQGANRSVGSSGLLNKTFDLAIELRTQVAILKLLENSEKDLPKSPGYCLRLVFYNEPDQEESDDSDGEQAIEKGGLRGWGTAAFSRLDRNQVKRVQERFKLIESTFPTKDYEGNPHYLDDLKDVEFQWEDFVLLALDWVRERSRELFENIRDNGGVENIVKIIKDASNSRPDDPPLKSLKQHRLHNPQLPVRPPDHRNPQPPQSGMSMRDLMQRHSRFAQHSAQPHRAPPSGQPPPSSLIAGEASNLDRLKPWSTQDRPDQPDRTYNSTQADAREVSPIAETASPVPPSTGPVVPSSSAANRAPTNPSSSRAINTELDSEPEVDDDEEEHSEDSNAEEEEASEAPEDDTDRLHQKFEADGLAWYKKYDPDDYKKFLLAQKSKSPARTKWSPLEIGAFLFYIKKQTKSDVSGPFDWRKILTSDASKKHVLGLRDNVALKDKAASMKTRMILKLVDPECTTAELKSFKAVPLKRVHMDRLLRDGIQYDNS
jgi:hypothetical protein